MVVIHYNGDAETAYLGDNASHDAFWISIIVHGRHGE
jgi:hypothetical protein